MGEHSSINDAFAGPCRPSGFSSESRCVCLCVCVCCPAAQRRVIQMCVCELYALDKSTLSHVFGLHGIFTQTLFLFVVNAWCTLWYSSPCGQLWREKVFPACVYVCVCVRQDLCPLCLHLLIVCTHLTGDTSAVSALAPLDGHAGDQTTNNWGKLWILWGRENARVLALSSDLRNKTFCI